MKDFLLIIVIIMSACSSQQYSQNFIINSEDTLVKNEAELFFFDQNLHYFLPTIYHNFQMKNELGNRYLETAVQQCHG